MIDLSALGLSAVQTHPHGGKRDKSGASAEDGKHAKTFGDLVSEAGKKNFRQSGSEDDAALDSDANAIALDPESESLIDLADLATTDGQDTAAKAPAVAKDPAAAEDRLAARLFAAGKRLGADDLPDADDLSAFAEFQDLTGVEGDNAVETQSPKSDDSTADGAQPQGRVRLSAGFQQLMKANSQAEALPEVNTAATEAKSDNNTSKKEQTLLDANAEAPKVKSIATPAEELSALLGLSPDTESVDESAADEPASKPVTKAASKTSAHTQDEDEVTDATTLGTAGETAATTAKVDATGAQAVAAHQVALSQASVDASVSATDDDSSKSQSDSTTNTIRLVSNDGKGQPVDIDLAKVDGEDSVTNLNSGKTDFVNVLESRRYLGFSSEGNVATLTNAIKAEPSWSQVIHGVNTGAQRTMTEVNTLKLQLNPEHLGNMTASLRLKGEELSIEVRVETVDAYRQLSQDQDSLVKALKDQGFSIDQVSVQLSPSARSDSGQNSGSQSQSGTGGQNLQEGSQGDTARQRDEGARRNTNNWMGNDRTAPSSDTGSSSDDTDAGNLYL